MLMRRPVGGLLGLAGHDVGLALDGALHGAVLRVDLLVLVLDLRRHQEDAGLLVALAVTTDVDERHEDVRQLEVVVELALAADGRRLGDLDLVRIGCLCRACLDVWRCGQFWPCAGG